MLQNASRGSDNKLQVQLMLMCAIQSILSTNRVRAFVRSTFPAVIALAVTSAVSLGQEPQPQMSSETPAATQPAGEQKVTAQTHPNNPELWNTEQMMDDAVVQISRRYNLNDAQSEYTRLLLTGRVRAFLDIHEKDIRELLRESIDLRLGKSLGSPQAYQKWAERAAPIYLAAQNAILEGNAEWREILDETQKVTHDADLAAMHANFEQVSRMLDTWRAGNAPPMLANAQQAQNAQQTGLSGGGTTTAQQGRVSDPQQPVIQRQVEDSWLAYVNRFIDTYQLDDKQAISARDKIYKDIRDQATRYRDQKRSEFAALDAETLSAKPKWDKQEIERRRKKLERPIGDLFTTLDQRLRTLPDQKQLKNADAEKVRQLEAWYKMLAGQFDIKESNDKKADSKAPAAAPAEQKPSEPPPPVDTDPEEQPVDVPEKGSQAP
jgi:hypothetical protein